MAPIKLYIRRDAYGCVQFASFLAASSKDTLSSLPLKSREIRTTKGLVYALIQSGTSPRLFRAAWDRAVKDHAIMRSRVLGQEDRLQPIIQCGKDWASIVDSYITEMVNNPKSKFYIYG